MKFRPLTEEEIEVRVSTVNDKEASLLLYKNARCDMNILDEMDLIWQRKHYECKGNLFCSVGIKCGDDWVWKDDCGIESFTEKEKGEASDSFKRACFNWGIGRELYTSPFIWVPAAKIKLVEHPSNKAKFTTYDKFFVEKIKIEDGKIIALSIKNNKKERVFVWQVE